MIKIENVEIMGWEHVIRGMRNSMNSWVKSDSGICKGGDDGIGCRNCAAYDCEHTYDHSWQLGKADHELMMRLATGGPTHAKYRRMITVYMDITAPLYWWKEFDTYRVGVTPNPTDIEMNSCSTMHKVAKDIWWQMIQLLPSSYNQKRTIMLNYEVLAGIHPMRKNHKLDEWVEFCKWIESLPYSEIIIGEKAR